MEAKLNKRVRSCALREMVEERVEILRIGIKIRDDVLWCDDNVLKARTGKW